MTPLSTLDIASDEELIYRGEGNSSLVIALQSQRKVIRLLKSNAKKLKNDDDNVLAHLLQHIDFNVNILPDVFPKCFFSPPQLFCLDSHTIERIKNLVKDKRPSFRLSKTINDCEYALLMTDYCCIPKVISSLTPTIGPVLAVEIKPKQGFLPRPDLFDIDFRLKIKSEICRFGLSQFHKLQKHSIKNISSYCPLDLFSGCPYRSLYSLVCLIENPQNNFRVFSDAQFVYGEQNNGQSHHLSKLKNILDCFFSTNISSNEFGYKKLSKSKSNDFYLNNTVYDSISEFCMLILQSLYMPYSQDSMPKVYQSQCLHDYSQTSNFLHEFDKIDSVSEYVFFRTFVQLFESTSIDSSDQSYLNFVNCNQVPNNESINCSDTLNTNQNNSCSIGIRASDNRFHFDPNNNVMNGNNGSPRQEFQSDSNSTGKNECLLHKSKSIKIKTKLNLDCHCKEPHSLTTGSVLDSILQAQKLDTLDSVKSVDLFNKLCARYNDMKQKHGQSTPSDSLDNESYRNFLKKFLLENLGDLNNLWRFLLSLTAKDCSIILSMQKINPLATSKDFLRNPDSMKLVVNSSTGERFVVSVSITDLDYKQAYKIQRMLYNDRRMINVFRATLKADPSLFSSELQTSQL